MKDVLFICGVQGIRVAAALFERLADELNFHIITTQKGAIEIHGEVPSTAVSIATSSRDVEDIALEHPSHVIYVMKYPYKLRPENMGARVIPSVNIHPSLLPRYRGGSPIFFALLDGCKEVGVTYHELSGELDAGAIFLQDMLPVSDTDCATSIAVKLNLRIIRSFVKFHQSHCLAELDGIVQDESRQTTVGFARMADRLILPTHTTQHALRLIRACGTSEGAFIEKDGEIYRAHLATPTKPSQHELEICLIDGSIWCTKMSRIDISPKSLEK